LTLGDRIRIILEERHIKQVVFAKTLGISANYVNLLANNKKDTVSDTLAKLIEETYGYSAEWLITGNGKKEVAGKSTASKTEILKKVQRMSDEEAKATLAYVLVLESLREAESEQPVE
jgi:transcriptional regulator with XRE-family HTH domain